MHDRHLTVIAASVCVIQCLHVMRVSEGMGTVHHILVRPTYDAENKSRKNAFVRQMNAVGQGYRSTKWLGGYGVHVEAIHKVR